jgi:hypothetical protein
MTQIKRHADRDQQRVEETLGRIATILVLLEHDGLRVHQAIKRAGLADLLSPVIDDHHRIKTNLLQIQKDLSDIWEQGQSRRWEQ